MTDDNFTMPSIKEVVDHYTCAESTAKRYIDSYKWAMKNLEVDTGLKMLRKNYNSIKNTFANSIINSRKVRLNGFLKIAYMIKHMSTRLHNKLLKYLTEVQKDDMEFNTFRKIDKKVLSWDEIQGMHDKLRKRFDLGLLTSDKWLEFVFLTLITHYPPQRTQDYVNTYVIENEDDIDETKDCNYLCLDTCKWIMKKGKTHKIYGDRILMPNKEIDLKKIISKPTDDIEVVEDRGMCVKFTYKMISPIGYLFTATDGKPLTTNSFGMMLNRKIGIRPSMIRNVFVSHKVDEGIDGDERKKIASMMGHSVTTQHRVYSKLSKTIQGGSKENIDLVLKKAIEKHGEQMVLQILSALN